MARSRGSKIGLAAYGNPFERDGSRAEVNLSWIREIQIAEIHRFPDYPFKVLMDEDMEQLGQRKAKRRIAPCHLSSYVGRILRTFKIKKDVEVTDNG